MLARERGNSHLRATIKTIDDWRGHLDLKIYLRGSASHSHTHTRGPHFKTGLNYWSALPPSPDHIPCDHFLPSPCSVSVSRALCIYIIAIRYIDGASNYEISYFISTPTHPHFLEPLPSVVVVISARPHKHCPRPLSYSLFSPHPPPTYAHPFDPPRSYICGEVRQNLTLVTIVNSVMYVPLSSVVSPLPLHNIYIVGTCRNRYLPIIPTHRCPPSIIYIIQSRRP